MLYIAMPEQGPRAEKNKKKGEKCEDFMDIFQN